MAINPFLYPGYTPEDVPGAPGGLYPGYYTGKALPRKPAKYDYLQPIEFQGDAFTAYIKSLDADVTGLPYWIKDQVVSDFKDSALSAKVLPSSIAPEDASNYDEDALPGAMGVSLNYSDDWIKDPKKQLVKTLGGWGKEVIGINPFDPSKHNINELGERVNYKLWASILSEDTSGNLSGAERAATLATIGGAGFSGIENPLSMQGSTVRKEDDGGEIDVYKQFGKKAFEYIKNSKGVIKNSSNNSMLIAGMTAIDTEMQKDIALIKISDPALADRANFFNKKLDVLTTADTISSNMYKAELKIGAEIIMPRISTDTRAEIDKTLGKLHKDIITAQKKIKNAEDAIHTDLKFISLRESDAYLDSLKNYRSYLDNLEKVVTAPYSDTRTLFAKLKTVTSGGPFGQSVGGLDVYKTSIVSKLALDMSQDLLTKPNGTNMAELVDKRGSRHAKGSVALMVRQVKDRYFYQANSYYSMVAGGKLMETIVWDTIKSKLPAFTPGAYAASINAKTHNWGFIINNDNVTAKQINSWEKNFIAKEFYVYKFTLANTFNTTALNAMSPGVRRELAGYKIHNRLIRRLEGGEHFKLVGNSLIDKLYVGNRAEFLALVKGDINFTDAALLRILQGSGFGVAPAYDFDDLQKQLDAYKKWVAANKHKFSGSGDNDKFMLALYALLKSENSDKDTISINTRYVGHLQKLFASFNKLQTLISNNKYVGFLLKNVFNLQTLVTETITRGISLLIKGLLTGSTGGIAVLVAPFIDKFIVPLLRMVVDKVINFGKAFFVGVFKGDIFTAFDSIEKEVNNLIKVGMYVFGLPLLLGLMLIMSFFTTGASSVSPIDPTKSPQGYGSAANGGGVPNENALATISKNVDVNGAPNPSAPLDNSVLKTGVKAVFTVTITPKVDIAAGKVKYTDSAQQSQPGGSKRLLSVPTTDLPAMSAGVPIVYTYTMTFGTGDEDSVISNTAVLIFDTSTGAIPIQATRRFGMGNVKSQKPGCENNPMKELPPLENYGGASVGEKIANRAYEIANVLDRGFTCFFNYEPEYDTGQTPKVGFATCGDTLWNRNLYENCTDPIKEEKACGVDPCDMFWCNHMVNKAVNSVYPSLNLDYFGGQEDNMTWLGRRDTLLKDLRPGDAIYYVYKSDATNIDAGGPGGGGSFKHTGIVYSISPTYDYIRTLESNGYVISITIQSDGTGHISKDVVSGLRYVVAGFLRKQ